jgi:hypothetical protein
MDIDIDMHNLAYSTKWDSLKIGSAQSTCSIPIWRKHQVPLKLRCLEVP